MALHQREGWIFYGVVANQSVRGFVGQLGFFQFLNHVVDGGCVWLQCRLQQHQFLP